MTHVRRSLGTGIAGLSVLVLGTTAGAQAPVRLQVDRDIAVTLESTDEHAVIVRLLRGARPIAEERAARTSPTGEVVPIRSSGRRLFLVRLGGDARVTGIVDVAPRPRWLFLGPAEFSGDPGERMRTVISERDVDGDGRADLVAHTEHEAFRDCGGDPIPVEARFVDRHGEWAALPTRNAEGATLVTGAVAVGQRGRFVLDGVQVASGGPPTRARSLTDGDLQTSIAAAAGTTARGAWTGPAITALVLAAPPGASLPNTVLVEVGPVRLRAALTGSMAQVSLPSATEASCVRVTVEDASMHAALAEVQVHTAFEGRAGAERLVDLLVEGSDGRAERWLGSAGLDVIPVLADAWNRLDALGRQRAIRAAGPLGDVSIAARALDDEHAGVREAGRQLLMASEAGVGALVAWALAHPVEGEAIAADLVRRRRAITPTSDAARAAAPRPELWSAPSLRRWVVRGLSDADVAGLPSEALAALAAAAADESSPILVALLEHAIARELSFEARMRLARAALVASTPRVDAWLHAQLARDEWMLRATAVESLGARIRDDAATTLRADPNPRVRLALVGALRARADRDSLRWLTEHDAWPFVRLAALDGLLHDGPQPALLSRALHDDASAMRAGALERLVHMESLPGALSADVATILDDPREWPHVTERALRVAERFCAEALAPGVLHTLERGARDGAPAVDVDIAVLALRIALTLGPDVAAQARALASRGASVAVFERHLNAPSSRCSPASGE